MHIFDPRGPVVAKPKQMGVDSSSLLDEEGEVFASKGPYEELDTLWAHYGHLLEEKVMALQRAVIERPITAKELEAALMELPTGKSPGHNRAT